MRAPRTMLRVLAVQCALLAGLLLIPGAASAALTHNFISSFGAFTGVEGVAVDQTSGDVYVYDAAAGSVLKFDAAGAPAEFSALHADAIEGVGGEGEGENEIAVDSSAGPAAGDIYVANGSQVRIYGADGHSLGVLGEASGKPWGKPCGVAVDSVGHVYVGLYPTEADPNSTVNQYTPAANPVVAANYVSSLWKLNSVCNIAVDTAGDVYADTFSEGPVTKYEALQFSALELEASGTQVSESARAVAVDPASGELYAGRYNEVAQYEPTGGLITSITGLEANAFANSHGVAVNAETGRVYVSDNERARMDIFGPTVIVPDASTGTASNLTATTATVSGHADPAGGGSITTCEFEYGTETPYGQSAPCTLAPPIVGATDVSANLTGLTAGVTYHYRLAVFNANGNGVGQDGTFSTEAPTIEGVSATDIGSEDATLRAQVNNHENATTYSFEYGTADCASNSCTAIPIPPGSLPASAEPAAVSQALHYLQPGVVYHYRLIATSSVGVGTSGDHIFQSFARAGGLTLPDNRAWELVSPVDKNGGGVASVATRTRAAADGDAIGFVSLSGFGDTAGMGANGEYESVRDGAQGTSGWSTHSIMPKLEPIIANQVFSAGLSLYKGEFSGDLENGVLATYTNLSGDRNLEHVTNLYLRRNLGTPGSGNYLTLTACSICATPLVFGIAPRLVGASANFDHVFFEAWAQLTADAPSEPEICVSAGHSCAPRLYEWDQGVVRYVGVLPASEGGGSAIRSIGARDLATSATLPGGSMSEDGSRVLFATPRTNNGFAGPLYMRVDHSSTVRVSASERTAAPDPEADAVFQAASSDLSKVFFMAEGQLTEASINGKALYEYDATKPAGHRLTLIAGNASGVIGASSDGSYLYFMSNVPLLPGQQEFPESGDYGVYLWHDGAIRFVGPLTGFDAQEVDITGNSADSVGARVTPSGKYLLFTAQHGEGLTGYDQTSRCFGGGCSELYLYNAETHALRCASCNPTGAPAVGGAGFALGTLQGGTAQSTHLNHPLSDDGRYVFFSTPERLVPEDHNGAVKDAYEYDSQTGQVHLLSSGSSNQPSYFMDASPDGHDVFFTTFERLVGWDIDTANDLYDARIGGGFPAPTRAVECEGDACSTPVTPPERCHTVEFDIQRPRQRAAADRPEVKGERQGQEEDV